MIKVILYGEKNDASLTLPLCRALSHNGGVLYIGEACVCEYSAVSPDFVVFETDTLENFTADKTIFIFKSSHNAAPKISPSDRAIIICDNDDNIKTDVPVITCGNGISDSISLSSHSDGKAVIEVRKAVTLFSGNDLEKSEFCAVTGTKLDGYLLLAICATLILSEKNSGTSIFL